MYKYGIIIKNILVSIKVVKSKVLNRRHNKITSVNDYSLSLCTAIKIKISVVEVMQYVM